MRKTVGVPGRLRVSCPSALHYIVIWVFYWNSEWLGTTFFKPYDCRTFWNGRGVYSSGIRSSSKVDSRWYKPVSSWILNKRRNPTASMIANGKEPRSLRSLIRVKKMVQTWMANMWDIVLLNIAIVLTAGQLFCFGRLECMKFLY